MLAKLGKFMRIIGLDTKIVDNSITDELVIQQAVETNRVLVTMDKLLYKRMKKKELKTIFIDTDILEAQLIQVINSENIAFLIEDIDNPISYDSRCSHCNSLLKTIAKKEVKGEVPETTYTSFEDFWSCQNETCGKIYWRGSHWRGIRETITSINNSLVKIARLKALKSKEIQSNGIP